MNKFFSKPPIVEQSPLRSKAILAVKIIVSSILIYFTFSSYSFDDPLLSDADYQMKLGATLSILFFLTLPTLFVFWLKKWVISRYPKFAKIWKFFRIIYIIILIIFLSLTINSFYRFNNYNKTQQTIDFINSKKITLSDVMGQNLPPKPDQTLNDSIIAGIDANNNFIRDDVELAIFEKYPNSAKIRAAMLQYAQALQLELTEVFNSETLISAIKKENIAFSCLGEVNDEKLYDNQTQMEKLVINTNMRNKKFDEIYKYMTTYSLPKEKECDINLSSLPN